MKVLKVLVATLIIVFSSSSSFAQTYEKEFEAYFAWEVKQIDEFIERFNNTDKTLIQKYSQKIDPLKKINREQLIKSLFNAQSDKWDINEVRSFIAKVNDLDNPVFLDFYDEDWYAKVNCSVLWKGKPEVVTLILKVQQEEKNTSKWVIAGVQASFLKYAVTNNINIPASKDISVSLNPVSHATDFMNIDRVSKDKANLENYFTQSYKERGMLPVFMNECLNNRLVINKVNKISYHFLQVNDWVIEINQFNRQTKNSGWLISRLIKVSPEEKDAYRIEVLEQ